MAAGFFSVLSFISHVEMLPLIWMETHLNGEEYKLWMIGFQPQFSSHQMLSFLEDKLEGTRVVCRLYASPSQTWK